MQEPSSRHPLVAEFRLSDHPGFWLRLVANKDGRLKVTNFSASRLSDAELCRALDDMLATHANARITSVLFSDLPMQAMDLQADRAEVCRCFDLLSIAVRRWAKACSRTIANSYLDFRNGLYSAVFELD